jgi:hybrid polyketide synthase/nonribosomal peptide synthetase ACE1
MVEQKTTITIATPSEYSFWFRQPLNMLKHCNPWKFALSVGENMSSSVLRNFNRLQNDNLELANLHGLIETTITCCMGIVEYKEYSADREGKSIPVGRALPNYWVWVGDHLSRALPSAWTGDIWVAGPGVGLAYFGSKDDENRFQTYSDTGLRCFRTGDQGAINENGERFVVSRHLDQSIAHISEFHIELVEISRTIVDQGSGSVAEAVVIFKSDNEQDEPQIQVFVVMNEAPSVKSRRYLQELLLSLNLPVYMRPTCAVI